MLELTNQQLLLLSLTFVWSGFVRTGIGFGGSALALPFMLLIVPNPVFLMPILATHFIFLSGHILLSQTHNVDWRYCRYSLLFTTIPAIVGIFGLISLPPRILTLMVYGITFSYGIAYLLQLKVRGGNKITDGFLLMLGGYVSGSALTGTPLLAVVFSRNVAIEKLRNSLFVAFIFIVAMKMLTFKVTGISWQFKYAAMLFPAAIIGHFIGLRAHQRILSSDADLLMRAIGLAMVLVTLVGISRIYFLS